jgi:hypothetical protein
MGDRFGDHLSRPATHSNTHSNTHRPSSQPCEWGRVRRSETRLMIGLSAEAEGRERVGTSDPSVLRLRQGRLPERAESAAGDRRRTPCPTWSEPDVVNAPLVNDIKRRGVRVP